MHALLLFALLAAQESSHQCAVGPQGGPWTVVPCNPDPGMNMITPIYPQGIDPLMARGYPYDPVVLIPQASPSAPPPAPPSPPPNPDGLVKHLSVGASVSNAQSTTATKAYIDVAADFGVIPPTATKAYPPLRIQLESELVGTSAQSGAGLAGQLASGDLSGFYSVRFNGSLHYVITNTALARTTVSIQSGVASVLASGPVQPTTANPGHVEACVGFWKKDHTASFNVCPIGVTNELGDPATAGSVDGRVTIGGSVPLRFQVSIKYPYGNAPSNFYATNTVHNVLTVVAISYDFDKVAQAATTPTTSASYRPWHHAPPTINAGGGRSGGAGAAAGF